MKKIMLIFILWYPFFSYARIDMVIIDPGHGGKDPGAVDSINGVKEKDVNLEIALLLKKLFEEKVKWVKVVLTREKDIYLSLEERAKIANKVNTGNAIFISIHTNSSENPLKNPHGIEVFYYDRSMEIDLSRLEDIKEFYAAGFKKELRDPISLMINEKMKIDSKLLAEKIGSNLSWATGENLRRVAPANFFVVSYPVMPSVLVEVGFIKNQKLINKKYQSQIAKGILLGILSFMKKENKF